MDWSPAGKPGISTTSGLELSANVRRTSARSMALSSATGWTNSIRSAYFELASGLPNVTPESAPSADGATTAARSMAPSSGARARRADAVQSSHASPAMRTAPSPFWSAPSSSGRDSAQPVP